MITVLEGKGGAYPEKTSPLVKSTRSLSPQQRQRQEGQGVVREHEGRQWGLVLRGRLRKDAALSARGDWHSGREQG